MRAAYYEAFQQPLELRELPEPAPAEHGALIRVRASGLCRSDWHGWMGHDPDMTPPHVPGQWTSPRTGCPWRGRWEPRRW